MSACYLIVIWLFVYNVVIPLLLCLWDAYMLSSLVQQCLAGLFFFRDRDWARFSLREKKVKLQRSWFPRKHQLKSCEKQIHYYTAIVARPLDPPKTTTAGRKLLKPAWNQARSSSPTQVTVSSTVRTRRSKVLSFLSFQSSQQIKTTIESKHGLSSFEIFFLESLHQATSRVCWGSDSTASQPSFRRTPNQPRGSFLLEILAYSPSYAYRSLSWF